MSLLNQLLILRRPLRTHRQAARFAAFPPWQSVQPRRTVPVVCMVALSIGLWQLMQPERFPLRFLERVSEAGRAWLRACLCRRIPHHVPTPRFWPKTSMTASAAQTSIYRHECVS
jgi:hypothetical protein